MTGGKEFFKLIDVIKFMAYLNKFLTLWRKMFYREKMLITARHLAGQTLLTIKNQDGRVVKVLSVIPGVVGSNPMKVMTTIPYMTSVLVGSRKKRVIYVSCKNLVSQSNIYNIYKYT